MEFSIVSEFEIIEEACKAANRLLLASPWLKFLSTSSSLPGFFKFLTVSDNYPLLTASDLTLGLVRFDLRFDSFLALRAKRRKRSLFYNFLILLNGIFHCS